MNIYRLLSYRNDFKAALSGRLPQRVVRKFVTRKSFGLARMICRVLGVGR